MVATGVHSVHVDECMNLAFVGQVAEAAGCGFGGNLKVTQALRMGLIDPREDAIATMAAGRAHKGFVLSCGAPLPYDTDPAQLERSLEAKDWYEKHYKAFPKGE